MKSLNVSERPPRVTNMILNVLKHSPGKYVKAEEICKATSLSKRQTRYALDRMVKMGLIIKIPNFNDLRSYYYALADLVQNDLNQQDPAIDFYLEDLSNIQNS